MEIKILQFDTYINSIKESVDSSLFRTVFAEVDGKKENIVNKGQFACALYVSSVLLWFGLIKERHTGFSGLIEDMKDSDWYKIDEPKIGAIIHWEKKMKNGEENEHVGFYIGDDRAISNNGDVGAPVEHHYTYGETDGKPNRKIEAIYWHLRLNNKYFEQ